MKTTNTRHFGMTFCAGLCIAFLGAIQSANAVPFQNGGFETPVLPSGTLAPLNYVYANTLFPVSLPGWVSTSSTTFPTFQNFLMTAGFDHVPNGNQAIELNGDGQATTTLAQTFDTTPGLSYQVSFELTTQTQGLNATEIPIVNEFVQVQASGPGNPQTTYLATGTPDAQGVFPVLTYDYNFVADGGETTLTFTQSGGSVLSPILDDVQIPEPASIGLLSISALGLLRRRRGGMPSRI